MVKNICILIGFTLIGLTALLAPGHAHAAENIRVLILPFEVYAQAELGHLKDEIPKEIGQYLADEGAVLLRADALTPDEIESAAAGVDARRQLAAQNGADFLVWGSLTWVGQTFSLDAKVLEAYGSDPPAAMYADGRGIEDLMGVVGKLAQDISIKIFKREKIAEIRIDGNVRIEDDAILGYIKSEPGDIFSAKKLSDDLKSVYGMGYFDNIRIEAEDSENGKIVVFNVTEKPTIRRIRLRGNRVYDDEKIKENLTLRTGSILNLFQLQNNVRRIEELYKEKNYHNVTVEYELFPLENNQTDLEFQITEGEKVLIKRIRFEGNTAFKDKKLKKNMKTKEKNWLSWFTSAGDLNDEDLQQDMARLTAFYHNHGYIDARVADPVVSYEGEWIYIDIKINEGQRYRFGDVDITGDLIFPKEALLADLKISDEEYYNREVVRNDVLALADKYSDEGYAYADIAPRIEKDPDDLVVHIRYDIDKGSLVYFDKIAITGNTRTRDKVIRRQLKVYEQELFSGQRIKQSTERLKRLDYFEDVKVSTTKGSEDHLMNLKIDVTEKPTGSFSFGGGYSSINNMFFVASVTQRNFLGKGQILQLKGEIGGRSDQYRLSFTEPWWFDIPLSAGIDIYKWRFDYDTYERDSLGGSLRFGYPVWRNTRGYLTYAYDTAEIKDVTVYAPNDIQDLEGHNVASSLTGLLRWDTRDRLFNTTKGSEHSISMEYAGGVLGGDFAFNKYLAETGWYFPFLFDTVFYLHSSTGYVDEREEGKLPDYERFYLGGINSLRGYAWRDVSLRDDDGNEIGGDCYIQFNFELIVPLVKEAGLNGVVFYDTGNVFADIDDFTLNGMRKSVGYGFRWYSPIGPIRIEYGHKLDVPEGEDSGGRWEFTMGQAF